MKYSSLWWVNHFIFILILPRDYAMLLTYLSAMARKMEVCNLDISDVDLENHTLLIRNAKYYTSIRVHISKECAEAIEEYIEYFRETPKKGHEKALFLSLGRRLSKRAIEHWIEKYRRTSRIPRLQLKLLRHTGITLFAQVEKNPYKVQEQARHSKVETTMRYIHFTGQDTKDSYNKFEENFNQKTAKLKVLESHTPKQKPKAPEPTTDNSTDKDKLIELYNKGLLTIGQLEKALQVPTTNEEQLEGYQ